VDKNDPSGAEYWKRKALGLPEPKEYKATPITVEEMLKRTMEALRVSLQKTRKRN
jgi:hypothetical protein